MLKAGSDLSASHFFQVIRADLERIPDHRAANAKIELGDVLMSGFAMFSLKDSSLLAFEQRRTTDANLNSVYGLKAIPGDTHIRTILDGVSPEELKPLFKDVMEQLRQG